MCYLVRVFQDAMQVAAYSVPTRSEFGSPFLFNAAMLADREPCLVQVVKDTQMQGGQRTREELLVARAVWSNGEYVVNSSTGSVILTFSIERAALRRVPKKPTQWWTLRSPGDASRHHQVRGAATPSLI